MGHNPCYFIILEIAFRGYVPSHVIETKPFRFERTRLVNSSNHWRKKYNITASKALII